MYPHSTALASFSIKIKKDQALQKPGKSGCDKESRGGNREEKQKIAI